MSVKIKVCYAIKEVESFIARHRNSKFILYLAHKDKEDWEKSTSRVYMNQISPQLIYLPVNIEKDDLESLRQIYKISQNNEQIIATNQTQPHKSNAVMKELFRNLTNIPVNIDAIIENQKGELSPYDLNGPAFVDWFVDEVDVLTDKFIILIGVGGAGEPIARQIVLNKPSQLLLVDLVDKRYLAKELHSNDTVVRYSRELPSSSMIDKTSLVVINAAGKEGVERPQLLLPIAEQAKKFGWKAYTGYGMNAINNYAFLCKALKIVGIKPPLFASFRKLVASAS